MFPVSPKNGKKIPEKWGKNSQNQGGKKSKKMVKKIPLKWENSEIFHAIFP